MSVVKTPSTGDVVEAFLTNRKRTLLRRALTSYITSIRKNPTRYKRNAGITSDRTVRGHLNDLDELFDDFNVR